jgi:ParB/RepB/Spo0J family partition protein
MDRVATIPIAHIEPFRDRDRDPERFKMLVASMARHGLIEPIIVAPNDSGAKRKYRLIAGHGRLRAAKKLGWQKITAVLRDKFGLTDFIVENWRKDLSPYEQAVLVELELRMGKSKKEVAEKFSVSVGLIDSYATVVRSLHPGLQNLVKTKKMPMHAAVAVARKVPERKVQETLFQSIVKAEKEGVTTSHVKTAVSDILGAIKVKGTADGIDSVEKLEKIKSEIKDDFEDTRKSLNIVRSHYIKSFVELRRILKEASVRAVFDRAGIDYKPILEAE